MKTTDARDIPSESPVMTAPSHEDIAARAYEIYMERAADEGTADDDWVRAERELLEVQLRSMASASNPRRAVRHVTAHDLASK